MVFGGASKEADCRKKNRLWTSKPRAVSPAPTSREISWAPAFSAWVWTTRTRNLRRMLAGFATGEFLASPGGRAESQTGAAAPGAMTGDLVPTLSRVASRQFPIARPGLRGFAPQYRDVIDASLPLLL